MASSSDNSMSLFSAMDILTSRVRRQIVVWFFHLLIFAASLFAAFMIRFEFEPTPFYRTLLIFTLPIFVTAKSAAFLGFGLNHGWWRYVSVTDAYRILLANIVGSVISMIGAIVLAPTGFPRSIFILDFVLCLLCTTGVRVLVRSIHDGTPVKMSKSKRILIYGAGRAGANLAGEISRNPQLHFRVMGFIDDNPAKTGIMIGGVKVLGRGRDLKRWSQEVLADELLIAMPSVQGAERTRVTRLCQETGVHCRTIPSFGEFMNNRSLTGQIRDVAVEDLLDRTPIQLDQKEIGEHISGKVILVTGAAGSIGSEICRQVARFYPAAIVAFEIAESPLFQLDLEMKRDFPDVNFILEIGSIQNRKRLDEVFQKHRPVAVYHAAAYKHVPMMEATMIEAVENNVFGTYAVATAASRSGVADFVMISSDKAVRPSSVMGVTKRMSELIIRSLQDHGTKFVSVRFGNVLASNGSVVPLFKDQIAAGGPVTVTHPDMTRYFMTIPEAVQLVLQAGTMGRGGEIFVLDMGKPVKIVDLARNLILLCGLRPEIDISIQFTGMRPGEKLFEELSSAGEGIGPTVNEKIKIFVGHSVSHDEMELALEALWDCCRVRDFAGLLDIIQHLVPEYKPSDHILQLCSAKPLAMAAAIGR